MCVCVAQFIYYEGYLTFSRENLLQFSQFIQFQSYISCEVYLNLFFEEFGPVSPVSSVSPVTSVTPVTRLSLSPSVCVSCTVLFNMRDI